MFTTDNYPTLFDRMIDWSRQMEELAARSSAPMTDSPVRAQLWLPAIDLYETESAFVIEADLPGVHQENVDVQFDRGTLTISGTRAATLCPRRRTASSAYSAASASAAAFCAPSGSRSMWTPSTSKRRSRSNT